MTAHYFFILKTHTHKSCLEIRDVTIFNPTSYYGLVAGVLLKPLIPFASWLTIVELYGGFKSFLINDSTFQK